MNVILECVGHETIHGKQVEEERYELSPKDFPVVLIPEAIQEGAHKFRLQDGPVIIVFQNFDEIKEVIVVTFQPVQIHHPNVD